MAYRNEDVQAERDTCKELGGAVAAAREQQKAFSTGAVNRATHAAPTCDTPPSTEAYPSVVTQLGDLSERCYSLNRQLNNLVNRLWSEPTPEIEHPMNCVDVGGTFRVLYSNLAMAEEQIARIRRLLGA